MTAAFATVVGVCTLILLTAHASEPPPAIGAHVVDTDRYPAHDVTFANGTRGIADVVFWSPVGYRPLTLDLYLPPRSIRRPTKGFPLVVYVHGGGWMFGDTRRNGAFVDFPAVLASLAAKGYVVASVEYRLSGEARFPAQAQDVKAAIRSLRLHGAMYGIDPSRAVTWGESAGGQLAALAAVSCGAEDLQPPASAAAPGTTGTVGSPLVSDCVQGAAIWFGVFDMATIQAQAREAKALSRETRDAPEWQLLGCLASTCTASQIAMASPVAYVDETDPPMLLLVGSNDTTVPTQQTLEMADRLKMKGVTHELIVLPDVDHNFLGKTWQDTRAANLKALAATFRFFESTVGNRTPRE